MRVLFLVQAEQRANLDTLYAGVASHCDCDLRRLSSAEQANLRQYFQAIPASDYDRILLFLRFKKEIRQHRFIRTIPNLCILEHDAYQNFIPGKYQGTFSRHYSRMPWARVISSGFLVTEKLCAEGYDAVFVPKGYDQNMLKNLGLQRDIELGFLGSTGKAVYAGRKQFLEELMARESLQARRTATGDEYLREMNRIRYFVSCDMGFGEYMIKNFEAMACGCVLMTYDQGDKENQALGLVDLENVVLYRDMGDFLVKLKLLRGDPELAQRIAKSGQRLAEARFPFAEIGREVVRALEPPLRVPPPLSSVSRMLNRWFS